MAGEAPTILGTLVGIALGTRDGTGPGTMALGATDGTRLIILVTGIRPIGDTHLSPGGSMAVVIGDGDITMLIGDGPEVTIMELVDTIHRITATMSAVTQVVTVQDWQPTAMDADASTLRTAAATASRLALPMATVRQV